MSMQTVIGRLLKLADSNQRPLELHEARLLAAHVRKLYRAIDIAIPFAVASVSEAEAEALREVHAEIGKIEAAWDEQ